MSKFIQFFYESAKKGPTILGSMSNSYNLVEILHLPEYSILFHTSNKVLYLF